MWRKYTIFKTCLICIFGSKIDQTKKHWLAAITANQNISCCSLSYHWHALLSWQVWSKAMEFYTPFKSFTFILMWSVQDWLRKLKCTGKITDLDKEMTNFLTLGSSWMGLKPRQWNVLWSISTCFDHLATLNHLF